MASVTREEQYLAYLNGEDVTIPEPITRVEQYLYELCLKEDVDAGVVADAVSDWLDEHGATMTKDANGYVKLGGTANGN